MKHIRVSIHQFPRNFYQKLLYKIPIRNFSFDKIKNYFYKSQPEKEYNKIIQAMATPETPGYKWLLFFKPECYRKITLLIGASPTVKEVVEVFWLNRHHDHLTKKELN